MCARPELEARVRPAVEALARPEQEVASSCSVGCALPARPLLEAGPLLCS